MNQRKSNDFSQNESGSSEKQPEQRLLKIPIYTGILLNLYMNNLVLLNILIEYLYSLFRYLACNVNAALECAMAAASLKQKKYKFIFKKLIEF